MLRPPALLPLLRLIVPQSVIAGARLITATGYVQMAAGMSAGAGLLEAAGGPLTRANRPLLTAAGSSGSPTSIGILRRPPTKRIIYGQVVIADRPSLNPALLLPASAVVIVVVVEAVSIHPVSLIVELRLGGTTTAVAAAAAAAAASVVVEAAHIAIPVDNGIVDGVGKGAPMPTPQAIIESTRPIALAASSSIIITTSIRCN